MRIREGLVLRNIGDEYVIVDPGQGMVDMSKVYRLNDTAAWLWDQIIDKDFSLSDLMSLVKEYYDVEDMDENILEEDMKAIILFLEENELLVV